MNRGWLVFPAVLAVVLVGVLALRQSSPDSTSQPDASVGGVYVVRSVLTLEDVEREAGVPVDHLIRELRLPENVPTDVPLRKLVSDLGLDMREVRRVVREYRKR
jgi:hypothetical protein